MADDESTASRPPRADDPTTPDSGVPAPTPGRRSTRPAPDTDTDLAPASGRPPAEPTRKVPRLDDVGVPTPAGPSPRPPEPVHRSAAGHTGPPPPTGPAAGQGVPLADPEADYPQPPPIRRSTGPNGYPPTPDLHSAGGRTGTVTDRFAAVPGPAPAAGNAGGNVPAVDHAVIDRLDYGEHHDHGDLDDDDVEDAEFDVLGHESILGPIEQFDVENAAPYDDHDDEHRPALTGPRLAAFGAVLLLIIGGIAFLSRSGSDDDGSAIPSVDVLARATVQIVGLDRSGQPLCSGSGTLVSSDGMILTNAHVVSRDSVCDFDSLGIAMTSDAGRPPDLLYGAELLALDTELDLAVLTVGAPLNDGVTGLSSFPAMSLGDSDDLHIGDDLRILGYPEIGGETITFTNGSVSGFTAQAGIGDRALIKTDATIAGGNSGGAAIDTGGRLIGIPTKARASESGPAVDCRPLADTNNDGQVDANDNCVPIGGFLNGLRPINLAKPLIEAAASATPQPLEPVRPEIVVDLDAVRISRPRFSLGESENAPVEVVRSAEGGIEELCLFVDWEGIPDGAEWDGLWYHDMELVDDFSLVRQTWDFGSVGNNFWMCAIDGDDGLEPGLYELGFFLAGELVFAEGIVLTDEPTPVFTTTWENTTEVDICGLAINPIGSGPAGLNELEPGVVIGPGQSVGIDLPAGEAVVEASDCSGEVVADSGGAALVIVEDRIYFIESPKPGSEGQPGEGSESEIEVED